MERFRGAIQAIADWWQNWREILAPSRSAVAPPPPQSPPTSQPPHALPPAKAAEPTLLGWCLRFLPSLLVWWFVARALSYLDGRHGDLDTSFQAGTVVMPALAIVVVAGRLVTRLRSWRAVSYLLPFALVIVYVVRVAMHVAEEQRLGASSVSAERAALDQSAGTSQLVTYVSSDGLLSLTVPSRVKEIQVEGAQLALRAETGRFGFTILVRNRPASELQPGLDLHEYMTIAKAASPQVTYGPLLEEPSVAGYWGYRVAYSGGLVERRSGYVFLTRSRTCFHELNVQGDPGIAVGEEPLEWIRHARVLER